MMMAKDDWDDVDDESNGLQPEDMRKAVVTDTDWTAETILNQLRKGNIQLDPRFQRRDAWDKTRKSRFIESLILGLPIPQIVLAEDKKRRGKFIVLDGKQRLLALRQFAVGSQSDAGPAEEGFTPLALSGLEVRSDLKRATLAKLEQMGDSTDLDSFTNQTIRTVVVRQWPNEDFLNLVFLRLNTGSVRLSPQELRQALHPGGFTDFLDDFSASSSQLQRALRIERPDFRMRDVEIMLRYFAYHYYMGEYSGNLKRFLDNAVEALNEEWETNPDSVRNVATTFDKAISGTFDIFGENSFYRWSSNRYEGRFNRAVFDIMTYYFSDDRILAAASLRAEAVERGFRQLCTDDREFVESIQTTTKTPLATYRRLERWGNALQNVIDVDVRIPELQLNRIVP
jgi:hypothetical protein